VNNSKGNEFVEQNKNVKWQGVNALLEMQGISTVCVQMQDGSMNIAPEKISEAIINLTNKNKMWEKKLIEYEKMNMGLNNQLKNIQSKN